MFRANSKPRDKYAPLVDPADRTTFTLEPEAYDRFLAMLDDPEEHP